MEESSIFQKSQGLILSLQAFNTKEQCIISKAQTGSCQRVTQGQPVGLLMEKWFSCVMILCVMIIAPFVLKVAETRITVVHSSLILGRES